MASRTKKGKDELLPLADRLHSACIHLLRRVRKLDDQSGLSAPKLSVLSVLVFGGPRTPGELAVAEQVKPPSMTRLVQELEKGGFIVRRGDPVDGRVVRLRATAKAERLLREGRSRRARLIAEGIAQLSESDKARLAVAIPALESLLRLPVQQK